MRLIAQYIQVISIYNPNKSHQSDDAKSFRLEQWLDADEKQIRVMDRSMLAVSTSLFSLCGCAVTYAA